MKKILSIALIGSVLLGCGSATKISNDLANQNPIVTSIDITKVTDDKLPVVINPGRFSEDTVTYHLPKVIPGTYALGSYGRFVDDFKALDYDGKEMTFTHPDDNTWVITNASKLDKLVYFVNDTYDLEVRGGIGQEMPFSPAGTNIDPNNYVLNLYGFIGFFDNLNTAQYTLDVTAPATFNHSSALQSTGVKSSSDGSKITNSYFAPRYFDIMDNPMMYGDLDIEEFMVGDIKIVLSVYSPNQVHTAASLKETVYKMMQAQKAYLGDMNSTPRYDVFLYLAENKENSPKGFGALEHHNSTTVVLREWSTKESLAKSMIDVVAHEFFHIVAPLSIHSEDVHYFDYMNPTFSKHLWLYEGVTEYFAQHFQVYEGLMQTDDFYKELSSKIETSLYFDDRMSFTEMSENVMDVPYEKNYLNVYYKGALIGACIDILMREESNGQRSLLTLMKELSNKYGIDKPFNDEDLISEITNMTYPSVGNFLQSHVVGNTPIGYNEFFKKVGLIIGETKTEASFIQGGKGFVFEADPEKGILFFSESINDNSFWVEQGAMPSDIIKEINGETFTIEKAQELLGGMYQWKPGQDFELKVDRKGEEIVFKGTLTQAYTTTKKVIENENATEEELALRKVWLNIKSKA